MMPDDDPKELLRQALLELGQAQQDLLTMLVALEERSGPGEKERVVVLDVSKRRAARGKR